ncbi:MAG: response regulator transcription factor [Candidatus Longimicrobiales bacterium M2_2A_002]
MTVNENGRPEVLVLVNDASLAEELTSELESAGFAPDVATSLDLALEQASQSGHEAYVVDVALPDGAGYRFAARLREAGHDEPILLLSAPHAGEDLLPVQRGWAGFQPAVWEGLHDAPQALRALLRHEQPRTARRLHYAGITLDRVERRLCVNGREIRLTPAEWDILDHLVSHAEHVVEREDLMRAVWGPEPDLSSNALDVHMGHLRKKLAGAGHADVIETIRGRGYMLRVTGNEPG